MCNVKRNLNITFNKFKQLHTYIMTWTDQFKEDWYSNF